MYTNCCCYHITLRVKYFYTNRSGAKYWLDIYHWGAGLAVTGRINNDIGQNVLQSAFPVGSSSSPVTATFCLLIAFLQEAFIKSVIILRVICINYIIIILVMVSVQYLTIIMESSKTLYWFSKFPWARERISSKLMDNLDTHPPKVRQLRSTHTTLQYPIFDQDYFQSLSSSLITIFHLLTLCALNCW